MRALLLATTLGAAQSMAVATKTKSKKPAVQALLESATTMLKDGATPEVVTFAEYTLEEVTGTVMPAIIRESVNDKTFIDSLYARFEEIKQELKTGADAIAKLNDEEDVLATEHVNCRREESVACQGESRFEVPDKCDDDHAKGHHSDGKFDTKPAYGEGKRPCEMQLYKHWEAWVTAEGHLETYHNNLHGHFCLGLNGTTHDFRVTASDWMKEYMAKKEAVDNALIAYDNKAQCCEIAHGKLDERSDYCNTVQQNLEDKACTHASKIVEVLKDYYRDYANAESAYNCAVEEVVQLVEDRKKEWQTLEVVGCLLGRIKEQNGRPCEESTGGAEAVLGECEKLHADNVCEASEDSSGATKEEIQALCITPETTPGRYDSCSDRDTVADWTMADGQPCLPIAIPGPCDADWPHYEALPKVPTGEFTSSNPGCNAYPQCTACDEDMTLPTYQQKDICPGYTVDGCETGGSKGPNGGQHELTYIRSVGGKADVRCCRDPEVSTDMPICKSSQFPAVKDFNVQPRDLNDHKGCYFDVTYQDALEICHEQKMRICTVSEMKDGDCCTSGCSHDSHAVWVDAQGKKSREANGDSRGEYQTLTDAQHNEEARLRDGRLRDSEGNHDETYQKHRCQEGMPAWPKCLDDKADAADHVVETNWKDDLEVD